jgi:ribosome-binding protein aMBF1 (putative translation factor)
MPRSRSCRGSTKRNAGGDGAHRRRHSQDSLLGGAIDVSSEDRLRAASERAALLKAFGARLRTLRIASGLSPGELAEKCRLSRSTISKAELGQYELRLSLIVILCDGLGCCRATSWAICPCRRSGEQSDISR